MEYFIIDKNGQQAGPFSLAQLIQQGITPETLVWKQGMEDWTPAWQVEELKNSIPPAYHAPEQPSQQQPSNNQGQSFNEQPPFNQQPPKKNSKLVWKLLAAAIVFILLIFAFTNPSEEAHKNKVCTEVTTAVEKATETTDNNFFTQGIRSFAKMMAGNFLNTALDELFEYHNYVLFSKGTVQFNGKEHAVSFGILGKVYTMNSDDMVKALEEDSRLNIMENESSSPNPSDVTGSDDATGSNDADSDKAVSNDVEKRLEDKANSAIDRITDKVSKKIEDKINQKIDEATDSSTVEKLVEKVLSLF